MKHYVTAICLALLLSAPAFGQMLRPVQDDKGLYGFENESGTMVIKPQYDSIQFNFYQGTACVVKKGKFLLINTSGKEISKGYTWIDTFDSRDMCMFCKGGTIDENGSPRGGKFGYLNLSGKEVIPAKYNYIGGFNKDEVASVMAGAKTDKNGTVSGGKFGFINSGGKIVAKPKYAYVGSFGEDGLALVNVGGTLGASGCTGGKFGYINEKGEEVISPKYSFIGPFDENGVCWVNNAGHIFGEKTTAQDKENDKWIDQRVKAECGDETDPKVLFETHLKYEKRAYGDKWDMLGNRVIGGFFGYINRSGKVIVPVHNPHVSDRVNDGRIVSGGFNGYHVYDVTGKEYYKTAGNYVSDFQGGVAQIRGYVNHFPYLGLIDTEGNVIAEPEYAEIGPMENGFAVAGVADKGKMSVVQYMNLYNEGKLDLKYGIINDKGQKVTQMKYDAIKISNGVARCVVNNFVGYVDSLGIEIVPATLVKGSDFSHNVAIVMIGAQDVSLNSKGNRIMSRGAFSTDTYGAKYGLINRQGVALTDFIFDKMYEMQEGLIPVEIAGQGCGWINSDGEYAIPLEYEMAGGFNGGYALAKRDGKFGIIDKGNNVIVDFEYDGVSNGFADHRVFGLRQPSSGKWGGLDEEGNMVIPFEFDSSDDVDRIADEVYVPKGCVALTDREVHRFKVRRANVDKHFRVQETIPDGYWDY